MTSRLAEILVKAKLVDDLQLRSAIARQAQWGGRLAKHVVELGFAAEPDVAEAIAKAMSLQRIELGLLPKDPAALAKVDVGLAEDKGVFPYALKDNGKTLFLAMADPSDLETADLIAAKAGVRVRTSVAGEREIIAAIFRHYKGLEPPAGMVGGNNRAAAAVARSQTDEPMEITDILGRPTATGAGAVATESMQRPTPQGSLNPASRTGLTPAPVPVGASVASPSPMQRPTPPPGGLNPAFAGTGLTPAPFATGPSVASPGRVSPARPPTMTTEAVSEVPPEVAASLNPMALEYVRRINGELEKTSRVLRGLVEVLVEKRVFSHDEIRAAIAKIGR